MSDDNVHTPFQSIPRTRLLFQAAQHQQTSSHGTRLLLVLPFEKLPEADQALYKGDLSSLHVFVTAETIFHPQGGGQPSDVGTFALSSQVLCFVYTARTSATNPGLVLHFGTFADGSASSPEPGTPIVQNVDKDKRHLFSRLHTAGHVLGAATRTLLQDKIDGFDELKASHFPDSASCEFKGLIDGKWKPEIQTAVDELVDRDSEVRIEWWTKGDFKSRNLERLIPPVNVWHELGVYVDQAGHDVTADEVVDDEKTRIRVVNIVGAEVYPCGGTHVPTTKGCGKVTARKISRNKGVSRISYNVD